MRILLRFAVALALVAGMTLAAEIDGDWTLSFDTEIGVLEQAVTYKTNGTALIQVVEEKEVEVGTFEAGKLEVTIKDYYSAEAGFAADLIIKAALEDGRLSGTWEFAEYAGSFSGARK